jgi:Tfp pilus assembly protein PilX
MSLKAITAYARLQPGLENEKGFLLVACLVLLTTLTLIGTTAYILASTDIKIGGSFRNSRSAFQAAQAGVEAGRELLRQANANQTTGADPTSFNSELVYYAAGNRTLTSGTLGNYTYTVVLSNDSGDAGGNSADSNNKVLLISTATSASGTKAVVEIAVKLPPPPAANPPINFPTTVATMTLLGTSVSVSGGDSNAKALNGDDQCGAAPPLPVVEVNASGSLAAIKGSINSSKPKTYHTKVNGQQVDASTNMDDIVKTLTQAQINSNGYDLNDAASLNSLVQTIHDLPQTTVLPGGSSDANVNLGDVSHLKVVVVDGDFSLSQGASGAGILVVKGELTFSGNFSYTGIIMAVGKGVMSRSGGGNGTISGSVWAANTAGPDGIVGTADDAMGATTLDLSGGGASNFQYCSSAVNNALAATAPPPTYPPLNVLSFRQIL